jgi:aspartate/methionine/tyrosine aminotransferase
VAPAFSNRTAWDLTESELSRAIKLRKALREPVFDLTLSNPTVCGFKFDQKFILGALRKPEALTYDPDPRGILSARRAVAAYYEGHGAEVDPSSLILTTSTSEAYSFLFRLLCDGGDQVLVAQPGYPLFDYLATLDDVVLQPYPLFYDFGWWIDFAELERRITPRTRAVLLVHPNNPTGHATGSAERRQMEELCARHGLALIVDEVFLDYSLGEPLVSFTSGDHACLTFVVSGLSKIAALPQMKVGWLAAFGPEAAEALNRLEVIADTFLSMNAPAQHALPEWLQARGEIQRQIVQRVRVNLRVLDGAGANLSVLPVAAGWSAVVRVPQTCASADLAERLVAEEGVIVHPGSFYGMAGANRLVLSLIVPPQEFASGVEQLNRHCEPNRLTSSPAL